MKILVDGVAKNRTEHADVIAATIAHANHGLGIYLISDAKTGSEIGPGILHVEVVVNTAFAGNADGGGAQVEQATVILAVDRFWEINIPTQTIADAQLGSSAPSILAVEEPALLPLRRRGVAADVAGEMGHVAQQESSQGNAAGRIGGIALVKGQLAGAVAVAGNTQIQGIADVAAKLNRMVAEDFGPVVDELILILAFQQGTVAAVDAEAEANAAEGTGAENSAPVLVAGTAEATDQVSRLAGGEVGTQIKAGNTDITRRSCAHSVGNHVHVIFHVAKAEVGKQAGTHGVIEAGRDALVSDLRLTGETTITEATSAKYAEGATRRLVELAEAVTAKDVHFLRGLEITANVEGIVVKHAGSVGGEVGDDTAAGGQRHLLQDSDRLRRNETRRNDVAGEGRERGRVVNLFQCAVRIAVLAQIAIKARQAGATHQRRGNRLCERRSRLAARGLVVAKYKEFVLDDGGAERATILSPQGLWQNSTCQGILTRIREGIARLVGVAAAEAKRGSVDGVAARFGLRGHYAGDGLAEFGVVVLAGDLRFGDRVERRIDDDDSQDGIAILGAIKLKAGSAEGLAVDFGLQAALRVFTRGMRPGLLLRTRRLQNNAGEVTVENGHLLHLLFGEQRGHVGAISLQLRRFR